MFDLIGFDADDTLWHNEREYRRGRALFGEILARYGIQSGIDERLEAIESRNLPVYGYGVVGFVFSLIEAGIELTAGRIAAGDIQALVNLSKQMLSAEVELFEHAEATLARLAQTHTLMLVPKGDLRHQQSKAARSGLNGYFRYVEIVSDKTPEVYAGILARRGVAPARFLMVGNSMRSDILPVIAIGGWAAYVPNDLTWSHETLPAEACPRQRFFELEHLGQLPALIERLSAGALS
jgi:putative hydrolase of the HAD superfamily